MKKTILHSRFFIKFWMVFWVIAYSLKQRVDPWKFFQLNASYFNKEKGIYSKQEINQLIPFKWRLSQLIYNQTTPPDKFPVFFKPEWGQNSYGVFRADSWVDFQRVREKISKKTIQYLQQEAAFEKREFEIYYVRQVADLNKYSVLSITEVQNSEKGTHPINGVYNSHTIYKDVTPRFNGAGSEIIWDYVRNIGNFRMARVCAKANSKSDLLKGLFHIVEINLFTPMPLSLLDEEVSWNEKIRFIKNSMLCLVENMKTISVNEERKNVFFKKLAMHYKVKYEKAQSGHLSMDRKNIYGRM